MIAIPIWFLILLVAGTLSGGTLLIAGFSSAGRLAKERDAQCEADAAAFIQKKHEEAAIIEEATRKGMYYLLSIDSGYAIFDPVERAGEKMPPWYAENAWVAEFIRDQCNQARTKVDSSIGSPVQRNR